MQQNILLLKAFRLLPVLKYCCTKPKQTIQLEIQHKNRGYMLSEIDKKVVS
jgi:hypothetical protein